jgi:hypothetical protein
MKDLTENFGFRKSRTSSLLEKCISSGSTCSERFSSRPLFLELLMAGRVKPAPRAGGAKIRLLVSLTLESEGVRKSMRKASFFSLLCRVVFPVSLELRSIRQEGQQMN